MPSSAPPPLPFDQFPPMLRLIGRPALGELWRGVWDAGFDAGWASGLAVGVVGSLCGILAVVVIAMLVLNLSDRRHPR